MGGGALGLRLAAGLGFACAAAWWGEEAPGRMPTKIIAVGIRPLGRHPPHDYFRFSGQFITRWQRIEPGGADAEGRNLRALGSRHGRVAGLETCGQGLRALGLYGLGLRGRGGAGFGRYPNELRGAAPAARGSRRGTGWVAARVSSVCKGSV